MNLSARFDKSTGELLSEFAKIQLRVYPLFRLKLFFIHMSCGQYFPISVEEIRLLHKRTHMLFTLHPQINPTSPQAMHSLVHK